MIESDQDMREHIKLIVNIVIALIFAIIRLAGNKSEPFQAFAHLYVGGLLTAAYLLKSRPYLIIGVIITIIETFSFFFI